MKAKSLMTAVLVSLLLIASPILAEKIKPEQLDDLDFWNSHYPNGRPFWRIDLDNLTSKNRGNAWGTLLEHGNNGNRGPSLDLDFVPGSGGGGGSTSLTLPVATDLRVNATFLSAEDVTPAAEVPEPTSLFLLATGLLLIAALNFRRTAKLTRGVRD